MCAARAEESKEDVEFALFYNICSTRWSCVLCFEAQCAVWQLCFRATRYRLFGWIGGGYGFTVRLDVDWKSIWHVAKKNVRSIHQLVTCFEWCFVPDTKMLRMIYTRVDFGCCAMPEFMRRLYLWWIINTKYKLYELGFVTWKCTILDFVYLK